MHRSGTSLIARILEQSGLYLGTAGNLLGGNAGNQDGHFEHLGFIELNDALLKHLGGSWDFPPELPLGWENAASLEPFRSQARQLLQTFAGQSCWGWKDPRTCLLLPFWQSLIPGLRFVICLRNPIAVAASLEARNQMPLTRGAYLWDRYSKASLVATEGCRRLVIFYDQFFSDPEGQVAALLKFCGLPEWSGAVSLSAFIRSDLRHQKHDIRALLDCDQIASDAKLLYLGLRALDLSGEVMRSRESSADKAISHILRLVNEPAAHQFVAGLQSRLNRSEAELATLRAEIWRDIKANHRWAYRFYRKVLRPFQLSRLRSSR